MKHRKYDTIIIGIDKDNNTYQLCHHNISCFAEYLWKTTSIGRKKRFEMRQCGQQTAVTDGHKIAPLEISDLSDYFTGFMTSKMRKALKELGIENAEFEKFLVVNTQSDLFGIQRKDIISVSFNSVISEKIDTFYGGLELKEAVEEIVWGLGYLDYSFS